MELAKEKQVIYEQDMKERLERKSKHEREMSENNFKTAIKKYHDTSRFEGRAFITDSPDARSTNSKTQSNFFGNKGNMFRSTFIAQNNQIEQEL